MDRLDIEQRRRNMRAVKSKDTKIELALRGALYRRGLRYRKNYSKVAGHPDVAFTRTKIAVFCDSEMWHGYDWERGQARFKSRRDFWIPKIERNMERDREVNAELAKQGWLVLRFWGRRIEKNLDEVVAEIEKAIAERSRAREKG
ncbi:MAG: very short patch repair endonuclease [Deltaproteobacteria bacterium]|jgi:DNA mismatch endonuclease Vsr|nr:very short patch repair endonuclease [Deltaproteobacteria bacterium]